MNRIPLLLLLGAFALGARAENFHANSLFSDHMVLQRGLPIRVWGVGDAGAEVTVSLDKDSAKAKIADGKWSVELPPRSAGGPYNLTVDGPARLTFADVMVGDVWICAGQSNMRHVLLGLPWYDKNPGEYQDPMVRLFSVDLSPSDTVVDEAPRFRQFSSGWTPAISSGPMSAFSAVGYLFGAKMQLADHIPIGLIDVSRGGTSIQTWLDRDTAQKEDPESVTLVDSRKLRRAAIDYNGMVAPVQKFPIHGIIWYQGEANATDPLPYEHMFRTLIHQWRAQWGEGDIPFYWVQLSSFDAPYDKTNETWPLIREAQARVRSEPHTGMAVAIDLGEVTYIHPSQKREVADRLVAVALKDEGGKAPWQGPRFQHAEFAEGKAKLHFSTDAPLEIRQVVMNHTRGFDLGADPQAVRSPADKLSGFSIAGADKKFVPADAAIGADDTVVVSNPQVGDPKSVRYGWSNFSLANLFDKNGFPAEPFRTDDWAPSQALSDQVARVKAALARVDVAEPSPSPGQK